MSSLPLAISVSDKVEQYGAYAGFAAVLGLAVLSLLYFAQAREVKRLREWAGRAPERASELQERVLADAQRRVAQPQPQPAKPAGPGAPGAKPLAPATAAGQAAAPATAAAAATAAGAAASPPATAAGAGQPTTVQPSSDGAAPAANGVSATPPPPPPGQPLRVPSAAATPPPRGPAATPPKHDDEGPRRSPLAIAGAVAAILVVGLIVAFVVLDIGGGDDAADRAGNTIAQTTPAADEGTSTTAGGTSTTPLKPNAYTTAVLNGTTVPGLARGVANRLQNANFKIGNVTNAVDQSHSATLIEYAAGHKREALAVAKAIDRGSDAVQPLTPGSKAIAGEEALVVVTVGADQNQSPQQQQ